MLTKKKKLISLVVTFLLFLTVFATMTYAADPTSSQVQITAQGSTRYYNSTGSEVTVSPVLGENAVVSVAKTIEGTDVENEFLMNVEVKTSVDISEVDVSADAAVVIVLDISDSMKNYMSNLKAAAKNFLTSYVEEAGGAARYASLVTFTTNAKIVMEWTDVTNPQNLANMQNKIDTLGASGGTLIEGGLMLARNLLRTDALPSGTGGETIENRSVILFSDGAATYYATTDTNTTQATADNVVGTTVNKIGGFGDTTDATAQARALIMAKDIKNKTSFMVKGYTYQKYDAYLYTIGFGTAAPTSWLENSVATNSSYAYSASNASQLNEAFRAIAKRIESWAEAWVVTDPMGTNIDFISTIPQTDIDTGLLKFENNTLSWDLKKASPSSFANNIYTYKYTYRIRLDTTRGTYVPNTSYPTNGKTELTYVMVVDGKITSDVMIATFSVPAVKGYAPGSFHFTKLGDNTEVLSGCQFTLTNDNKAGHYYTDVSRTGTGSVSFANIPSGHTYTLKETSMPESHKGTYRQSTEEYTVAISYGKVIIKDGKGNEVTNGFVFNNPLRGRTLTGLVWPQVWDDLGVGDEFLEAHQITVELRPSFLTPAKENLKTVAVIENYSNSLGRFTIEDVPVGTYLLCIERAGFLTRCMPVTVSPSDPDEIVLTPPGSEDNGIFNLRWGDVNNDFVVDASDISYVVSSKSVDVYSPRYLAACDFNADGVIDASDIAYVLMNKNKTVMDYAGAENVDFNS